MERDGAAPGAVTEDGTLDAPTTIVSALVLLAVASYLWAEFRPMEPATLWMFVLMSFLTPALLSASLAMLAVAIAMLVFLRRSRYRASIALSFALMLAGAVLVGLASMPRSEDWPALSRLFGNSMGFVRAAFMADGMALAVWGATTALLSVAARRASRLGSPSASTLRRLAAVPTLLAACVFLLTALVMGIKGR